MLLMGIITNTRSLWQCKCLAQKIVKELCFSHTEPDTHKCGELINILLTTATYCRLSNTIVPGPTIVGRGGSATKIQLYIDPTIATYWMLSAKLPTCYW